MANAASNTKVETSADWPKERIDALDDMELLSIVLRTKPDGRFAQQLKWAEAELERRDQAFRASTVQS